MSDSGKAVFLSYAREDSDSARRIADALRAFGIEVWFDQNELRGGDAWDAKIKQQIRECSLFLPIVSARTQERHEGYFRREWKLAVERTHDMAAGVAFVVPVVIDETPESEASVPEEFMRVQWTRLTHGVPSPQFVDQVKRLLETPRKPAAGGARLSPPREVSAAPVGVHRFTLLLAIVAAAAVAVAIFFATRTPPRAAPAEVAATRPTEVVTKTDRVTAVPTVSAPASPALGEKSIAVLPFANMSTEKENEFFADGVHEDVITNLAKIRDIKVISRTSVLAYRDPSARNLKRIAAELGVAAVLEGSVRRAGTRVRVTAQLIDARTDQHLWAETYDQDVSDIFTVQATLAREIAGALKATLTTGERLLIERRPTENTEAYDLYVRARAMQQEHGEEAGLETLERIAATYEQAIAKDPAFALAYVQLALTHSIVYWFGYLDPTPERRERMKAAVDTVGRLAPDAPETHLARGAYFYRGYRDWNRALAEFRIAEAGLPNDAQLCFWLAITHRRLGKWPEAVEYFTRSMTLNPRDRAAQGNGVETLVVLRRYEEARRAAERVVAFFPSGGLLGEALGKVRFALDGGRRAFQEAMSGSLRRSDGSERVALNLAREIIGGNLAAADRVLAEAQVESIPDGMAAVVQDPLVLWRALIAFLRDDRESARRWAEQAAAYYRGRSWNDRQRPWVRMKLAQAAAYGGRNDEAVREAEGAQADIAAQDAYDMLHLRVYLGGVYIATGRRDAALAGLREIMREPCIISANEFRIDPLWSRLKDDPRFEEILQSAKPL